MISILKHLQKYVPYFEKEESNYVHKILLGGDQLSTSMAKRVQAQRSNSTSTFEALEGLIPVCEDWHTKLCLLTVLVIIRVSCMYLCLSLTFDIGYLEEIVQYKITE